MTCVRDFLEKHPTGLIAATRAKRFHETLAGMWQAGSRGSGGHGWHVTFNRVDSKESRIVLMDYPMKSFYTTAELDMLAVKSKNLKA